MLSLVLLSTLLLAFQLSIFVAFHVSHGGPYCKRWPLLVVPCIFSSFHNSYDVCDMGERTFLMTCFFCEKRKPNYRGLIKSPFFFGCVSFFQIGLVMSVDLFLQFFACFLPLGIARPTDPLTTSGGSSVTLLVAMLPFLQTFYMIVPLLIDPLLFSGFGASVLSRRISHHFHVSRWRNGKRKPIGTKRKKKRRDVIVNPRRKKRVECQRHSLAEDPPLPKPLFQNTPAERANHPS